MYSTKSQAKIGLLHSIKDDITYLPPVSVKVDVLYDPAKSTALKQTDMKRSYKREPAFQSNIITFVFGVVRFIFSILLHLLSTLLYFPYAAVRRLHFFTHEGKRSNNKIRLRPLVPMIDEHCSSVARHHKFHRGKHVVLPASHSFRLHNLPEPASITRQPTRLV